MRKLNFRIAPQFWILLWCESVQEINAQFLFVNQKFFPGYRQIEFWIFFGG